MRLRAAFFDGAKSAAWEVREVKKTKENNTQKVRKLFSSVRVQARDFRVMKKKKTERGLEKLELLMKKATERLELKLKQKKP